MMTLLFSLLLTRIFAAEPIIPGCVEQTPYSVEGKTLQFCWIARIEGWVSSDCIRKKSPECGALTIHELASKKSMVLDASDARGGKNPGSAICMKAGGKVKYATLEGGSQQTFCEAGDGSLIDSNAITNAYYSKPKVKGEK